MCTLAHVFEAAVLSTVLISSIRDIAERMHPSRALYAQFPLELFLGKPRDAAFQHRVLQAALALLEQLTVWAGRLLRVKFRRPSISSFRSPTVKAGIKLGLTPRCCR